MAKLSVITINYNNRIGLEKTIASVKGQDFKDYEYLIIDGASTDGSISVIEKNQASITQWVSEPDSGVYHAMNKGIKKATGEYLLFLNSGDFFYSDKSLFKLMKEVAGEDFVYGNILVQEKATNWIKKYPSTLNFSYFLEDTLPHPATLIKRTLLGPVGYNEGFCIVSDWEFFIVSICKNAATYKHVDQTISVFNIEGISSNPENAGRIREEKKTVLESAFRAFLADYETYFQVKQEYQRLVNSRPHKALSKIKKLPFLGSFFNS